MLNRHSKATMSWNKIPNSLSRSTLQNIFLLKIFCIPSQLMAISPNFSLLRPESLEVKSWSLFSLKHSVIASHLNWQKSWKPMQTNTITHQPPSWQFLLYPHFLLILSLTVSLLTMTPPTLASLPVLKAAQTLLHPILPTLFFCLKHTSIKPTVPHSSPTRSSLWHHIPARASLWHIELCLHFPFISLSKWEHHLKL